MSIFLFIVSYTIFMIFDVTVVLVDWQDPRHHSDFVLISYKVLVWFQAILSLLILTGYVILFVFFLNLMHKDKQRYGNLYKQVIGFFTVMLFILTVNFILNIIFYDKFNKNYMNVDYLSQEKLVSITTYAHTVLEMIFNVVLLSFLITQHDRDA